MARFDIYTADIYFDDGTTLKSRPILQLYDNSTKENCFAVITSNRRVRENGDTLLDESFKSGLTKESTVRLSKRITNPTLKKHVGKLTTRDQLKIAINLCKELKIEKHVAEDIDDDFTIKSMLQEVTLVD